MVFIFMNHSYCVSTVAYGTTEFVEKGTENVVFSTCDEERERVVFQMGTSDAVRALKAAEIVYILHSYSLPKVYIF